MVNFKKTTDETQTKTSPALPPRAAVAMNPMFKAVAKQTLTQKFNDPPKALNEVWGSMPSGMSKDQIDSIKKTNALLESWEKAHYVLEITYVKLDSTAVKKLTVFSISAKVIESDGDTPVGQLIEIAIFGSPSFDKKIAAFGCAVCNLPPGDGVALKLSGAVSVEQTFVGRNVALTVDFNQGDEELTEVPGMYPHYRNFYFDPVEKNSDGSFSPPGEDLRYG